MNHHEFHDPCALLKQVTPAVKRQVVSLTLVELENLTRPRGGLQNSLDKELPSGKRLQKTMERSSMF